MGLCIPEREYKTGRTRVLSIDMGEKGHGGKLCYMKCICTTLLQDMQVLQMGKPES